MFYAAFFLVAIGTSSLSPTVIITPVNNWFRKKLGIATGIMASGFALGGLLVPAITTLIDIYDWRTTLFIIGVATWVICLPLSSLVRHKPEQYGYVPDGEQNSTAAPQEIEIPEKTDETSVGVKEALKSSIFWRLSLAFASIFMPISAMTVHVMPYLNSVGIARSTSSLVAMSLPLGSIVGRLGAGWLCDRFSKRWAATGFFMILGVGLLCFSYVSSEGMWLLVISVIFFGTGWGSNFPLRAALLREYFGREHFGTIFGFMMGIAALGGIIGPFFAGWGFDNWDSYRPVWLIFTCLIFIAVIIMATTTSTSKDNIQRGNRG